MRLLSRLPPWPRRTARLRLTALYGGLFVLCGVVLLAITYVLVEHAIGRGLAANQQSLHGSYQTRSGAGGPEIAIHKLPLRQVQVAADRKQVAFDLNQLLVQ